PPVGLDGDEPDAFGFPSSRADEALSILSALRQLLITHMIVQSAEEAEGGGRRGERTDTSGPPRGPEDNGGPAPPVENSSEQTGPSQAPT
ncbi:hypothetical protein DKP78_19510, partial [Enterococcus faecium]